MRRGTYLGGSTIIKAQAVPVIDGPRWHEISAIKERRPGEPKHLTEQRVYSAIASQYPKVPKCIRKSVAVAALKATWGKQTLHWIAYESLRNFVVFDICGYARLVQSGLPRDIAAELIKPTAEMTLTSWDVTPPPQKSERALR